MGFYKTYIDGDGQFRFALYAPNGHRVLRSAGHNSLIACENGIASVQRHAENTNNFSSHKDSWNYTFTLLAPNGQPIGYGNDYLTEAGRNNGITSVQKHAGSTTIEREPGTEKPEEKEQATTPFIEFARQTDGNSTGIAAPVTMKWSLENGVLYLDNKSVLKIWDKPYVEMTPDHIYCRDVIFNDAAIKEGKLYVYDIILRNVRFADLKVPLDLFITNPAEIG